MAMTKVFTGLLCLLLSVGGLAVEVKPLKNFTLSRADGIIIQDPNAFIVTKDDRIILSDSKAANIKIFDMTGKRVKIFGRKGMGPNEFVQPRWMAYQEPYIAFMDFGRDMVFIYKLSGNNNFEFVQKFLTLNCGYDFSLIDEGNVIIAGDKRDKDMKVYDLYSYNIKKKEYDFILPSHIAYRCKSQAEFWKDNGVRRLGCIGYNLYFDMTVDSIYFVWRGSHNVIKINRKTKEIKHFGEKTKNFVTPHVTPEIRKAFNNRDHRLLWKLDRPMSAVTDIFVSKTNKVGVVYVGPFKDDGTVEVRIQFYTGEGKFLNEVKALTSRADYHHDIFYYFRKIDNRLYILDKEPGEDLDHSFKMHVYQVEE